MTNIVKILSDIQERLVSALPELEYVDKDRGQLSDGNTEIKFPCALLDVKNIDFSLEGKGIRMADIQLVVTIAYRHDSSTDTADNTYKAIELLEHADKALHLFTAKEFTPLFCSGVKKTETHEDKECYEMTYRTFIEIAHDTGDSSIIVDDIELEVK